MKKYNVINLHFTDVCNYQCSFCFAKKEDKAIDYEEIIKVIDQCEKYFKREKIKNPRINLVGGEPLTYSKINKVINYIHSKKITCSIITNGYLLNDEFLEKNQEKVKTIGISIDSLSSDTNKLIGRCTKNKNLLTQDDYLNLCNKIISYGYGLKINICVSKKNVNEISLFTDFLSKLPSQSYKLKIMKMVIVSNRNSHAKSDEISDEDFNEFCSHLLIFNPNIEDKNTMFSKYLMINSDKDVIINNHLGEDIIVGNILHNYLYLSVATNGINETIKIFNTSTNYNYYLVKTKFGHVGRNNYCIIDIPIYAKNKKEASKLAIETPRVKHDDKNVILDIKKITNEEYKTLKFKFSLNPFFICKTIQEQRSFKNLDLNIIKNEKIAKPKRTVNTIKAKKIKILIDMQKQELKYYTYN